MHFSASLLFSLTVIAIARPQAAPAVAAGSKKNVYLSTCTSRSLLDTDTASAVVYYNGLASSRTSPSDIGVVSEPARKWEGASRRVTLNDGRFTSSISAGADSLSKSQIAGSAKLGDEDFVCFVDGTSTFSFREGLLGLRETNCKADYWCASTNVGNPTPAA